MPLWAASLFPALIWGVMATTVALVLWRARATSNSGARGWVGATLGSGGVLLLGGQAAVVRANLDHSDWREADTVTGCRCHSSGSRRGGTGGGLIGAEAALLAGPFALASVLVFGFASVQARVTERGLEVAFGSLGWPARRWPTDAIAAARVEARTPAQVGGWGYRLSGLGTTVMLRSGECLVIRTHTGKDFAVSVDDAERGAALLDSLNTQRSS